MDRLSANRVVEDLCAIRTGIVSTSRTVNFTSITPETEIIAREFVRERTRDTKYSFRIVNLLLQRWGIICKQV